MTRARQRVLNHGPSLFLLLALPGAALAGYGPRLWQVLHTSLPLALPAGAPSQVRVALADADPLLDQWQDTEFLGSVPPTLAPPVKADLRAAPRAVPLPPTAGKNPSRDLAALGQKVIDDLNQDAALRQFQAQRLARINALVKQQTQRLGRALQQLQQTPPSAQPLQAVQTRLAALTNQRQELVQLLEHTLQKRPQPAASDLARFEASLQHLQVNLARLENAALAGNKVPASSSAKADGLALTGGTNDDASTTSADADGSDPGVKQILLANAQVASTQSTPFSLALVRREAQNLTMLLTQLRVQLQHTPKGSLQYAALADRINLLGRERAALNQLLQQFKGSTKTTTSGGHFQSAFQHLELNFQRAERALLLHTIADVTSGSRSTFTLPNF